jgi:hypothetical protein
LRIIVGLVLLLPAATEKAIKQTSTEIHQFVRSVAQLFGSSSFCL